ncbi:MAG: glycoside hydrolase domain-containing protein [Myxococcota bacterium]
MLGLVGACGIKAESPPAAAKPAAADRNAPPSGERTEANTTPDNGAASVDNATPSSADEETRSEQNGLGTVANAPPDVKGFDCFFRVTEQAKELASSGYGFAVRYVPLDSSKPNLTREEIEAILDAGLALMIVQEGAGFKDQKPTRQLGAFNGTNASKYARELGYPPKAMLWVDVEAVEDGTAQDVFEYVSAWASAVSPLYTPGLYVGEDIKLSDEQLSRLPIEHFWRAGADHHEVPSGRGFQLIEHGHSQVAGLTVDDDLTQDDKDGGSVLWLQPRGWKAPTS